jgi:hypothetical protein
LLAFAATTIVISLIVAIIDIAGVNRGGLKFFVFRNAGAGAGNPQDFEEGQGPGQADAPGAHKAAAVQKAPTKAATPKATASQK